jgi:ATP-dependent Clp protease ATP-binding subunit ClpA
MELPFTSHLKQAYSDGQKAAQGKNSNILTREYLLIGLLNLPETAEAEQIFRSYGIDVAKLEIELFTRMTIPNCKVTQDPVLSSEAGAVFRQAQFQAQYFGRSGLSTGYLLLALLLAGDSVAAKILRSVGLRHNDLRDTLGHNKGLGNWLHELPMAVSNALQQEGVKYSNLPEGLQCALFERSNNKLSGDQLINFEGIVRLKVVPETSPEQYIIQMPVTMKIESTYVPAERISPEED